MMNMKLPRGKYRLLVVVLILALAMGCYWLVTWLLNPMRALKGFLKAIEQKNIGRIYSMVLWEEKEAGLTKEQVAKVLEDTLYQGQGDVECEVIVTHWIADRWFYGYVLFWKTEDGKRKPLPRTNAKHPTVVAEINLFRPPRRWGWQISFTRFAWRLLFSNYAPVDRWVANNPKLKEEKRKIVLMRREWARKQMRDLWEIREVFPLPVMSKMRGRNRVFWGKWQEEGEE